MRQRPNSQRLGEGIVTVNDEANESTTQPVNESPMYSTALILHSWLRWIVLLLGVWTVASAASAMRGHKAGRAGRFFTIALDVQMLVGILLYVALSPITRAALTDMAAAMRNDVWRFWTVEHPALMILAVVFAHVGWKAAKREDPAAGRPSRLPLLWFTLAVAAILVALPWPFLGHGRPLVRW